MTWNTPWRSASQRPVDALRPQHQPPPAGRRRSARRAWRATPGRARSRASEPLRIATKYSAKLQLAAQHEDHRHRLRAAASAKCAKLASCDESPPRLTVVNMCMKRVDRRHAAGPVGEEAGHREASRRCPTGPCAVSAMRGVSLLSFIGPGDLGLEELACRPRPAAAGWPPPARGCPGRRASCRKAAPDVDRHRQLVEPDEHRRAGGR